MSRSLFISAAGIDLTGLTFEGGPGVGLSGFFYENGVRVPAPTITVKPSDSDPTVGFLENLPEVPGNVYAITVSVGGSTFALHYPPESFFPFRVVAHRGAGQALADLVFTEDTVEFPGVITAAIQAGGLDSIISGWTLKEDVAQAFAYTIERDGIPQSVGTDNWLIASAGVLGIPGSKPPYSIDDDLEIFDLSRLDEMLQNADDRAERIARARCEADGQIDAELAVCYATPFKVDLAGTWTVGPGSQAVTGTGGKAATELVGRQLVTIADETREVLAVLGEDSFSLKTPHVGGATDSTAVITPSALDAMVRRWSYVLTLRDLLPGARGTGETLKAAIADVRAQMKSACNGTLNLPGAGRTDSLSGFAFVPLPEDLLPDPAGDLAAAFHSHGHRHGHSLGT